MTKIVSGVSGWQAAQWRKTTAFASRVGSDYLMQRGEAGLPLPEGATFYAPLVSGTADRGGAVDTFARNSEGNYVSSGGILLTAATNIPRFELDRLLIEPASTNLCQNFNAEIDAGLDGITAGGDSTISRVDDTAELVAAGLGSIGNGFAVQNVSGGGTANANIAGSSTAAVHSVSAWIRKVGATGTVSLRTTGNSVAELVTSQNYTRIAESSLLNSGELVQVRCTSGGTARFLLNQMELVGWKTSETITQGASSSRAADLLSYANPANFLNQPQGMAAVRWSPKHPSSAYPTGSDISESILSFTGAAVRFLRLDISAAGALTFVTVDSNTGPLGPVSVAVSAFNEGDVFDIGIRWKSSFPDERQIGYSKNGGAWTWSAAGDYSGTQNITADFSVAIDPLLPKRISHVILYEEDQGTSFIEDNFPP